MTTQLFDDLSGLLQVQYCDRILVVFDYPNQHSIGFRQHPDDKEADRVPFVTYIGGETKEELRMIVIRYKLSGYSIRESKRMDQSFEMKIKGMSFDQLKQLIKEL